ncbi:MAG: hypothetical protein H7Y41_02375 [Hyphomonadaceae bacterium]|nr:hypothetical protein [Clostridia bacterium]
MESGGIGNIPNLQNGYVAVLTPVLTLASAIINISEAMAVPSIESALFACGVILLITCMSLTLFTKYIEYVIRKKDGLID